MKCILWTVVGVINAAIVFPMTDGYPFCAACSLTFALFAAYKAAMNL
jgi:hypothetical protein